MLTLQEMESDSEKQTDLVTEVSQTRGGKWIN